MSTNNEVNNPWGSPTPTDPSPWNIQDTNITTSGSGISTNIAPGQSSSVNNVTTDNDNTEVENVRTEAVVEKDMPSNPQNAKDVVQHGGVKVANAVKEPDDNGFDLVSYLEKKVADYKPLTQEQLEKLRRKQRAEGIISGISDAVRSIANLVSAHHYAPNMYDAKDSMTSRAKARFDKEKADRDAEDEKYYNYAITLKRLKDSEEQKDYQRERDKKADEYKELQERRAQAKEEREAAKAAAYIRLQEARANGVDAKAALDEYKAEIAKIDQDYREQYWGSVIGKNNRSGSGSGGGSKNKYFNVHDKDGNIVRVYETELNDMFNALPQDVKNRHRQTDAYGDEKTPTREQMKQAVTDHIQNTSSQSQGDLPSIGW